MKNQGAESQRGGLIGSRKCAVVSRDISKRGQGGGISDQDVFYNWCLHFQCWYSGLFHVMKFIPVRAVRVSFVLPACGVARVFPGSPLCQIHACVVWLTPPALRGAGKGSLGQFEGCGLPQTPAFVSLQTSLYSVYVLGLFSAGFYFIFWYL